MKPLTFLAIVFLVLINLTDVKASGRVSPQECTDAQIIYQPLPFMPEGKKGLHSISSIRLKVELREDGTVGEVYKIAGQGGVATDTENEDQCE